jgi:hypothetical protein
LDLLQIRGDSILDDTVDLEVTPVQC